jgi:hypothetical protein
VICLRFCVLTEGSSTSGPRYLVTIKPFHFRFTSPKHVQQRVLLTGLNTENFAAAIQGLARIDSILRQAIREDTPRAITNTVDGFVTIDFANRYFTSKKFAKEEHHVAFTKDVDPKGILAGLRGDAFVHTVDNVVEYYQRQVETGGHRQVTYNSEETTITTRFRFKKIQPSHINKGDIVEIQFTANLVEHASGKGPHSNVQYITKFNLRSITLLDGSTSEVCPCCSTIRRILIRSAQSIRMAGSATTQRQGLKRKVGYEEEETRETQDRMKRMTIDRESSV